jgi:ribosomal-protein-alanine N-acetyltransferase
VALPLDRAPAPHLRPMAEEDLGAVVAIESATFPNPWPYEALAFELKQNPFCAAFVTELSDEVVAYAYLWVMYDQSHLINIAVAEGHRGEGLGEAMLLHCMRHARLNGCRRIHLEVRENNAAAIALYEKHGFLLRGRQKNYYNDGTPALFMEAELAEEPRAG